MKFKMDTVPHEMQMDEGDGSSYHNIPGISDILYIWCT